MDSSSRSTKLAKDLREARIRHQREYFIPSSELKRLITPSVIKEILHGIRNMEPADAETYANRVEQSSKKLFAILSYLKNRTTICSLLDSNLSDKDLPFTIVGKGWSLWRREPKERIQAFDEWDDENIEEFERTQWWMLAPVFNKESLDCLELADEVILPFMPLEEHEKKNEEIPHMNIGGYSEVTAHRIHPAHHNFWKWDTSLPLESQPLVADKKLLSPDWLEFLKEKTILDALGRQNHPNLIQLLASYQKKKSYHLLFPCAECNLTTYWKKNAVPNFDKETVPWSMRQMLGITSALDCIHAFKVKISLNVENDVRLLEGGVRLRVEAGEEKYGRHGDIKPENILWFKDEKVLKITDFGLGRFHGRDSRSGIDGRKVFGTLTYEPPECSLGRLVSRKYDIWSLGCLFLEFITWLLEGSANIVEFSNARGLDTGPINDDIFFTVFRDEDHEPDAEVRVGVIDWVNRLHFNKNCSALIHDLLDLVMGSMLRIDPESRKTAQELKVDMESLVKRAENSDSYLINGFSRSLPLRPPQKRSTSQKEVHWAD